MNIKLKIDRWLGVRAQSITLNKSSKQGQPLAFFSGMSRSGNHLLHSLIDGHKGIRLITEEDFFLRTNIGSFMNMIRLFYYYKFGSVDQSVEYILDQNKVDNWKRISNKETGEHEVDFDIIEYEKFKNRLVEMVRRKHTGTRSIYQGYIDCLLDSIPGTKRGEYEQGSWRSYFTANADFLIRPILNWDEDSKVIISVRDPLQRFASHKKWDKVNFICTPKRLLGWKKVHQSYNLFKEKYAGRVLIVDYTDLVNDVESTMRKVASFLGLEYDKIMNIPTILGNPVSGNTSFIKNPGDLGGIYKGSLEKYKDILSNEEINIIKKELRPLYDSVIGRQTSPK